MQTLQIIFTVLAAACVAVLVPVGTIWGWGYAGLCGLLAVMFFLFMKLCKQSVEMHSSPLSDELPKESQDDKKQE